MHDDLWSEEWGIKVLTNWSHVEFSLNNAFWHRWGHDAALPFRIANLVEIQKHFSDNSVSSWLHGGTLRDGATGQLSPDHDDDLRVKCADVDVLQSLVEQHLVPNGFEIVRKSEEILSVFRYGLYVDLHPFSEERQTLEVSVHGHSLVIPSDFKEVLQEKYGDSSLRPVDPFLTRMHRRLTFRQAVLRRTLVQALRNPSDFLSTLLTLLAKWIRASSKKNREKSSSSRELTLEEFLSLRIDEEDSINWSWRGRHMRALYMEEETLRETLNRLGARVNREEFQIVETELSRPVPEPLHLSYEFWNRGDNYFLYPFLYGYRHLVVPYHAANLWITWIGDPMLYSAEYFESLVPMSDAEIRTFLRNNPIELVGNSVVSGRHRVSAMLGRLFREEGYIPIFARELKQ